MNTLTISLAVFVLITACGGDDDNGIVDARSQFPPDATANIDAVPQADADTTDADPNAPDGGVNCLALADYGSPTLTNQLAEDYDTSLSIVGQGNLNADIDAIVIELYAGVGAFSGGSITTGTFTITGAELQYSTCGVCPLVLTDIDGTGFPTDAGYLATSGSVTLTSVSGTLQATLNNITFEHVEIDASTLMSTPHIDGCTSAVTLASLDVAIVVIP